MKDEFSLPTGKNQDLTKKKPVYRLDLALAYTPGISLEELERYWILQGLKYAKGNIAQAAKNLGVARETMYRRVREYRRLGLLNDTEG